MAALAPEPGPGLAAQTPSSHLLGAGQQDRRTCPAFRAGCAAAPGIGAGVGQLLAAAEEGVGVV
jgi:hypothetical protein